MGEKEGKGKDILTTFAEKGDAFRMGRGERRGRKKS